MVGKWYPQDKNEYVKHTCVELLKKHEGLELKPYRCTSGKLSIGYGRNLEDRGITPLEAQMMLDHDVAITMPLLASRYEWFECLSPARQIVCINMAYNLGMGGFHGFKKMRKNLAKGLFKEAAAEMLDSNWAKQVGQRAIELSEIMEKGRL
jgi:lysozyme